MHWSILVPHAAERARYTFLGPFLDTCRRLGTVPRPAGSPAAQLYPAACGLVPGLSPLDFFAAPPQGLYIPRRVVESGVPGPSEPAWAGLTEAARALSTGSPPTLLVTGGLGKTMALLQWFWAGIVQQGTGRGAQPDVAGPIPCWLPTATPLAGDTPFWDRLALAAAGLDPVGIDAFPAARLQDLLVSCPPILFFVDIPAGWPLTQQVALIEEISGIVQRYRAQGHRFVLAARARSRLAQDPLIARARTLLPELRVLAMDPLSPTAAQQEWLGRGRPREEVALLARHLESCWCEIHPFVSDARRVQQEEASRGILVCNSNHPVLPRGAGADVQIEATPAEFFGIAPTHSGPRYIPLRLAPVDPGTLEARGAARVDLATLVHTWFTKQIDGEDSAQGCGLVLLGDAGSGKTTELFRSAMHWPADTWESQGHAADAHPTPVLITATTLLTEVPGASAPPSPRQLLSNAFSLRGRVLQSRLGSAAEVLDRIWNDTQREGPYLFLVDDLDDIRARYAMRWRGSSERLLFDLLAGLRTIGGGSLVIMTSRKPTGLGAGSFLQAESFAGWSVYEIQPLTVQEGRRYLCRLVAPDWQPEHAIPDALRPILERTTLELLTSPILLYLLSGLARGAVAEDLACQGYPGGTQLTAGLVCRLAVDHWLRIEFNEYGYYDRRCGQGTLPAPGRPPTGGLALAGIGREFYERVLQRLAYLHYAPDKPSGPEAVSRFGLLAAALGQLFEENYASDSVLPEGAWWPRQPDDRRLPRGFARGSGFWVPDPHGLGSLVELLLRSTFLHQIAAPDHRPPAVAGPEPGAGPAIAFEFALGLGAYWAASSYAEHLLSTPAVTAPAAPVPSGNTIASLTADLVAGRPPASRRPPTRTRIAHAREAQAVLQRSFAELEWLPAAVQPDRTRGLELALLSLMAGEDPAFAGKVLARAAEQIAGEGRQWLQAYRAALERRQETLEQARASCTQTLSGTSSAARQRAEAQLWLGEDYLLRRGQPAQAAELLAAATGTFAQRGEAEDALRALGLQAEALERMGRFPEIRPALEQALAQTSGRPGLAQVLLRCGLLFEQHGDLNTAIRLLRQSIVACDGRQDRLPERAQAGLALGRVLRACGQQDEAADAQARTIADLEEYRRFILNAPPH